jgi:hypothetical protein
MKNVFKFLGIIALVAIIGFAFTACGDGDDDNNGNGNGNGTETPIASFAGTWNASGGRSVVFTGNNFNYKVNGTTQYSGTFSVSGSTITFTISTGTASGNFTLSGTTLTLSNHTWDNSVNGTYTKDSGSGNGNGNGSTTVFISGRDFGICYWENGERKNLSGGNNYGMAVAGSDVYVAGYYNSESTACYWKNGTMTVLPKSNSAAYGQDVAVVGSDVYVAGYHFDYTNYKYIACYWKNGIRTDLSTDKSEARAIFISGSDVYIAGYNDTSVCYWKNGTRTNLTPSSVSSTSNMDITVVGSDIYVAASGQSGGGGVWKNGTKISDNNGSYIAVSGSDVYVSGNGGTSDNPIAGYWKNGIRTNFESNTTSYDIAVAGSDVYVVGMINTGTGLKACYWKNGVRTDLHDTVYNNARATSIVLVMN